MGARERPIDIKISLEKENGIEKVFRYYSRLNASFVIDTGAGGG